MKVCTWMLGTEAASAPRNGGRRAGQGWKRGIPRRDGSLAGAGRLGGGGWGVWSGCRI